MRMQRASAPIAYAAGVLLVATGALHLSAYKAATAQVADTIRPLFATLWIFFGAAMVVSALMVAAVAPISVARRGVVLCVACLLPLTGAALMLGYLGFLPPVVLLVIDGALIIASAAMGSAGNGT